jgi:hypothetical protein
MHFARRLCAWVLDHPISASFIRVTFFVLSFILLWASVSIMSRPDIARKLAQYPGGTKAFRTSVLAFFNITNSDDSKTLLIFIITSALSTQISPFFKRSPSRIGHGSHVPRQDARDDLELFFFCEEWKIESFGELCFARARGVCLLWKYALRQGIVLFLVLIAVHYYVHIGLLLWSALFLNWSGVWIERLPRYLDLFTF